MTRASFKREHNSIRDFNRPLRQIVPDALSSGRLNHATLFQLALLRFVVTE
jgi:hypothetical protein